jgi:hypothetical protein
MEQMVVVVLILGLMFLGHSQGNPLLNVVSVGFIFYLAFTVGVPALMIVLIFLGIFEMVYVYYNFK